jgi:hypothetical protein
VGSSPLRRGAISKKVAIQVRSAILGEMFKIATVEIEDDETVVGVTRSPGHEHVRLGARLDGAAGRGSITSRHLRDRRQSQ